MSGVTASFGFTDAMRPPPMRMVSNSSATSCFRRSGKQGRDNTYPVQARYITIDDQVAESVAEQMEEFAKAKSAVEGTIVYFGVIDGDDSNRLLKAYPKAFIR